MNSRQRINMPHAAFAAMLLAMALGGPNPAYSRQTASAGAAQQNNAPAPATASAAVPQIIQFSGQLNGAANGGSAPVAAGTVSITFALYENEQGGTALWSDCLLYTSRCV